MQVGTSAERNQKMLIKWVKTLVKRSQIELDEGQNPDQNWNCRSGTKQHPQSSCRHLERITILVELKVCRVFCCERNWDGM